MPTTTRRGAKVPPMPALGDAHQVLMEEVMAEEDANSPSIGAVGSRARLDPGHTVELNDDLSSSEESTDLEGDGEALAEAQLGPVVGDFELEQRKLNSAADEARQEEPFQSFFENVNNVAPGDQFQYIMMVARGVVDGVPGDLVDLNEMEPFKAATEARLLGKSKVKLTVRLCTVECKRRNPKRLLNKKNTTVKEFLEWLTQEMPIQSEADKAFIKAKYNKMVALLVAGLEQHNSKQTETQQRVATTDHLRWICMLECTDDDTIKKAYLGKDSSLSRSELDSRKSVEHHVKTLHELAVEKFNDPSWIPYTRAIPSLHSDFAQPVECPKREDYDLTVEKSKKMLQSMKTSISKMIIEYNKSGNGSDMVNPDEEDLNDDFDFSKYGHFNAEAAKARSQEGDNLIDGDDRYNFVAKGGGSIPSLYWWDTLDQHGLLHCTQGIMKGSCKADGRAASSTAYGSAKKKKRKGLDGAVIEVDNGSQLTESQTRATESIERMTRVHELMAQASQANAFASQANALGRDEQALVGIQNTALALEDKVFELEDQVAVEADPQRKARLQRRLETTRNHYRAQVHRYESLKDDIQHRRRSMQFSNDEAHTGEEEEEDNGEEVEEDYEEEEGSR